MKDLFVTDEEKNQALEILRQWDKQQPPKRYSLSEALFGWLLAAIAGAGIGINLAIHFLS